MLRYYRKCFWNSKFKLAASPNGDKSLVPLEIESAASVNSASSSVDSCKPEEPKWLARYRQRQRFKRNAEQKNLLKSGKEVTREEEKSDWPEDSNDDVPSTPSSASGDQTPAKKKQKALDKRSTRTDYQKNKPYTNIKELVSRLTAKPVCTAEKVALLPSFMQK